jgi:hypothetical protein
MEKRSTESGCLEVCQNRFQNLEESKKDHALLWEAIKANVSIKVLLMISVPLLVVLISWSSWLTVIQISVIRDSQNSISQVGLQLSTINNNLNVLSEHVKLRLESIEERQKDVYGRVRDAENERFRGKVLRKGNGNP